MKDEEGELQKQYFMTKDYAVCLYDSDLKICNINIIKLLFTRFEEKEEKEEQDKMDMK